MSSVEKALQLLKNLPQVTLSNLKPLPGSRSRKRAKRGQHGGMNCGKGKRGMTKRNTLPRLGFEGGATPLHIRIPREPYYEGVKARKQYPQLSLLQLQRLIDLGRVDPDEPVDLTTIGNTIVFYVEPGLKHYGINLTDEGSDIFKARVNIEVQWTNELSIAAIEKNGGTIITRFLDVLSVNAMMDPAKFFQSGTPIPRCKLPSPDVIDFYSDAKNRGYLANPEDVEEARLELAQKYGYVLPDIRADSKYDMLMRRKDPRQIWFGLAPGWVVNMHNRSILKPKDPELKEYYTS